MIVQTRFLSRWIVVGFSLTASTISLPSAAYAKWEGTTWGMTAQEVVEAVGGEMIEGAGEPITYNGEDTFWKKATSNLDYEGSNVNVDYLFKDGRGLQRIVVKPSKGLKCGTIIKAFEKRLGKGKAENFPDLYLKTIKWSDPKTTDNLTEYMLVVDKCSVLINPFPDEQNAVEITQKAPLTPEPEIIAIEQGKSKIGDWIIEVNKSNFNDSQNVYAFVTSAKVEGSGIIKPDLNVFIRCVEDTTNVLFTTSLYMSSEKMQLTYRIDNQDAVVLNNLGVSTNYKTTGFWTGSSSIDFIRKLITAEKLAVRIKDDDSVEAVFNLAGIRTVAKDISTACKWKL